MSWLSSGVHWTTNLVTRDNVVAAAGIIQAVFAVVLVFVMRCQSRIMRQQAAISGRQMTIAEEPRLAAVQQEFKTPFGTQNRGYGADYILEAVGKTPLTVVAYFHEIVFIESLPKTHIQEGRAWTYATAFLRPGECHPEGVNNTEELSESDFQIMRGHGASNDKRQLFLVAKWVYDDIFGNQHEYGFCYCASRRGGAGFPYGGSTYNYRRLRNLAERL